MYEEKMGFLVNPTEPTPITPKPEPPKKQKKTAGVWLVVGCFLVSLLGGMLGYALASQTGAPRENPVPPVSSQSTLSPDSVLQLSAGDGELLTTKEVIGRTADSVVEIMTEQFVAGGRLQQYISTGAGSGVILSADGYIVTNNHVIEDASKITVTLRDGTSYDAVLVGTDAKTDVAVIKVEAQGLTPAALGSSSTLEVGDDAIVIGNPLGQLGGSVTTGIISALDRQITIDNETMVLLQTNAAVNPGNSGGAMFNRKGELIGIVNAKSSGTGIEGIGFAIPVDIAAPVIDDLIQFGYVTGRPYLGVSLIDVKDYMTAMMYRVNEMGVYIQRVAEGTNAAHAGLTAGDRLLTFNGETVTDSTQFVALLGQAAVGEEITLTVARGNTTVTLQFILQEYAGEAA